MHRKRNIYRRVEAALDWLDKPDPGSNDELVGYFYRWSTWRAWLACFSLGGIVGLAIIEGIIR